MNETLAKHNFRIGDQVRIKGIPPSPPMEILDVTDHSLLVLQAPNGAVIRVARLAVMPISSTTTQEHEKR